MTGAGGGMDPGRTTGRSPPLETALRGVLVVSEPSGVSVGEGVIECGWTRGGGCAMSIAASGRLGAGPVWGLVGDVGEVLDEAAAADAAVGDDGGDS